MSINKLENQIKEKKSFLCIGLDIDLEKIPNHLKEKEDPIFLFAKDIIDSTNKFAVAHKPNIAFFEAYGISGWKSLEKIIRILMISKSNNLKSGEKRMLWVADL